MVGVCNGCLESSDSPVPPLTLSYLSRLERKREVNKGKYRRGIYRRGCREKGSFRGGGGVKLYPTTSLIGEEREEK